MTMTNTQQFNPTVSGYYLAVLRSKYFYASIAVAVVSWIAMRLEAADLIQSYLQFGALTVPYHEQILAFFAILYRYSVPLAEEGILGYFTLSKALQPIETIEAKFADVLPAGTPWQNISLQFLDDENVIIRAGQFERKVSYADMGFADNRGKAPRPNEQWKFLLVLGKLGGEISFKNKDEVDPRYKKQKELLSKTLKSYFRIDYDPFHAYGYKNSYRIKMKLMMPETETVSDVSDPLSAEIRSYYADQAPLVNDTDVTTRDWLKEQDSTGE
jgi:hypothetical protein